MSTVWLCPGQGTQKVGMGRDLAERFPAARDTFDRIDDALGTALSRVMFAGPDDELTRTDTAQPAILAHTAAAFAVVGRHVGDAVAAIGHSLGEYSAYVTAGALDATAAVRLVRRRGELMHEAGTARPGAMAAVLGLATAAVETACAAASDDAAVAVAANLNAADQTVISGDPAAVTRAGEECRRRGAKRVIPLKVSGAFHSPLMAPAAGPLSAALAAAPFREPAFPVIANATGEPVATVDRARTLLAEQLTAPVRWVACVQTAAQTAGTAARFIEIGPGNVLGGLVKRILPGARVTSLGTADDITRFLEAA